MQEINLYDLLRYYARYWALILALTIGGFAAGLIYNYFIQVPMYKSSATLILIDDTAKPVAKDPTVINNYLELIKSRRVLEPVIQKQHLSQSYEQLAGSLSTSNDKDTEVIKISVSTTDPQVSKKAADGTVTSFRNEVKHLYSTNNFQVVDGASTPKEPYNVHKPLQLVLFSAAGFLVAVVTVFFMFDFSINKPKTVRRAAKNAKAAPTRKRPSSNTRKKK